MGVNSIVRGADILSSVPRQLYLSALLGAPAPAYAHIPLLLTADGERLAKRHTAEGSPYSLASLRDRGVRPKDILSFFMCLSGFEAEAGSPGELAASVPHSQLFSSLKGRSQIILPAELPF